MGTLRGLDALHHKQSQSRRSTVAAILFPILLILKAVSTCAWQIVPAGSKYPPTEPAAPGDDPDLPLEEEWLEVEFGEEEAPDWLPDPYTLDWPNTIAVCAMMKDEHPKDVQEFLEYHRWIGVDTFYLREHGEGTSQAVRSVLEPYELAGVLDFDTLASQKPGLTTRWYNGCSRRASHKHAWVAFIDVDEFVIVLDKGKAVAEQAALKAVLRRSFRYTAAVSLQWVLFGSGGHKERPPGGQLRGFQRCTGVLSKQMKCLGSSFWLHQTAAFLPKRTQQCTLRIGGVAVLGNGEPVPMWEAEVMDLSVTGGRRWGRPPVAGTTPDPPPDAEELDDSPTGATYMSHLSSEAYAGNRAVSDRYQLAIFHYITGSADAFLDRKYARAGKFGLGFEKLAAASGKERWKVLREWEADLGLDGDAALCRQGAALADAMAAARAAGRWSPLPVREGLLFT